MIRLKAKWLEARIFQQSKEKKFYKQNNSASRKRKWKSNYKSDEVSQEVCNYYENLHENKTPVGNLREWEN